MVCAFNFHPIQNYSVHVAFFASKDPFIFICLFSSSAQLNEKRKKKKFVLLIYLALVWLVLFFPFSLFRFNSDLLSLVELLCMLTSQRPHQIYLNTKKNRFSIYFVANLSVCVIVVCFVCLYLCISFLSIDHWPRQLPFLF